MTGIQAIAKERIRQQEEHDLSQDDAHEHGELAGAGACFALWQADYIGCALLANMILHCLPPWRPFSEPHRGPGGPIRNLAIAGAFIAAEIDRLQRREDAKKLIILPHERPNSN